MRRALTVALVLASLCSAGAANAATLDGFQVDLGGEGTEYGKHIECNSISGRLECWFVGQAPPGARCDEIAVVPSYILPQRGVGRQGFVCMDEGFHGWRRLSRGQTWRGGGYTCRVVLQGTGIGAKTGLRCFSSTGAGFLVTADGTVTSEAVPQYPTLFAKAVSLGDSYSSGEGNAPFDSGTDTKGFDKCHRAPLAWPRLIGLPGSRHLACSGAVIDNLSFAQMPGAPDNVPQLTRLRGLARTESVPLVTITIGGNDAGFAKIVKSCRVGATGCLRRIESVEVPNIQALREPLERAYEHVREAAGGARVIVVGYPDIFPGPGETWTNCGWMTDAEKPRVERLASVLNATISAAAAGAGVDFVNVRGVLDGHELCTRDSWVFPITSPGSSGPTDQRQAHPYGRGQKAIATAVADYLTNNPFVGR